MTDRAFTLKETRFDLSTYLGRCQHFYLVNDPRTLLATKDEIFAAQRLIKQFEVGELPPDTSNSDLWNARSLIESTVHPDTKEILFPLARMSSFVPVNMIMVSVMLAPAVIASIPLTIGVHWLNQSYNAAINFANRNASNDIPMSRIFEGYSGAVTTAVSIGLAATYVTKKVAAIRPSASLYVRAFLPFFAVSMAGIANIVLMRRSELEQGVPMIDYEGKTHGKSVIAAQDGLFKCALTRIVWNVPIMVFPPLLMAPISRMKPFASNPRLRMAAELGIVTLCLIGGVSPAIALFPQIESMPTSKLEPEFRDSKDSHGALLGTLYYNKGL